MQTTAVILSTTTDRLEAYVVVKDNAVIETRELRDKLRHLPGYMQPETFFFIHGREMPRLPSGKINPKALQDTSAQFALAQKEQHGDGQRVSSGNTTPRDGSDLSIILGAMVVIPTS